MKPVKILTHAVTIDRQPIKARGMVVVEITEDSEWTVKDFDGAETAGTIFISGVLEIQTDGEGAVETLLSKGRSIHL